MNPPPAEPLRIILDIAAFGLGFVNPAGRCGIYRLIDELLSRSAQLGATELALTATRSPALSILTEAEIRRTHPELLPAWHPSWQATICSNRQLARFARYAQGASRINPIRWLAVAVWRAGLATARAQRISGTWDIFHSLSDALPDASRIDARVGLLTVHDLTPLSHPELHLQVTKDCFSAAVASLRAEHTRVVCVSESTRRELSRLAEVPPERTSVILLAADARFRPAPETEIERVRRRYRLGEGRYFLCLSSVEPRKNLPATIKAFSRFHQQLAGANGPADLSLVIAGPTGWMSGTFEQELSAAKAPIVRPGFIADEDLPALYSGCHAFVYLSLAEGFGLPPLEAMACGAPVLTSNTTSLPEVVGDAGLMIDPLDQEAMVTALHQLLDDQLTDRLRARARERARRFSWETFTREHRDLYQELNASSRR